MLRALTLPIMTVDVRVGERGPLPTVVDESGTTIATAAISDLSLEGELRRWFGNPAAYPFTVQMLDPEGGCVFTFDKARESSLHGHLLVTVRLADGSEIGTVRKRWPLSQRVEFSTDEHALVASAAVGRYSQRYDVVGEPDRSAHLATVEPATSSRRASADDAVRSFRITFAEDAAVLIRALTLAHLIAADMTLFPKGRAF